MPTNGNRKKERKITQMSNNTWFCSDHHFNHTNIIKYANRPFETSEEMDEAMIENHNAKVKKGDIVYMLGDVLFANKSKYKYGHKILSRLNGNKFLIYGNHDKTIRNSAEFDRHFTWQGDAKEIRVNGQKIYMLHYAMRTFPSSHHGSWNLYASAHGSVPPLYPDEDEDHDGWQLYGHSHGSLPDDPTALAIDVGVDCHNFSPISFDEVKAIMDAKLKNIQDNNLVMTKDHHTVKITNEKTRL